MFEHNSDPGCVEGPTEVVHRSESGLPGQTYNASGRSLNSMLVEGLVAEVLPRGMFIVDVPCGNRVTAHLSGSDAVRLARILEGDRVRLKLSPVDPTRGRITDII